LLAGDTDADRLKEYIDKINPSVAGDDIPPVVLSPSCDKAHRTVNFQGHKPAFPFPFSFNFVSKIKNFGYLLAT